MLGVRRTLINAGPIAPDLELTVVLEPPMLSSTHHPVTRALGGFLRHIALDKYEARRKTDRLNALSGVGVGGGLCEV